jgi:hypothetical protein
VGATITVHSFRWSDELPERASGAHDPTRLSGRGNLSRIGSAPGTAGRTGSGQPGQPIAQIAVDEHVALVPLAQPGHLLGQPALKDGGVGPLGSLRVEETTYLGMVLNLSANSPSWDGQAWAKVW